MEYPIDLVFFSALSIILLLEGQCISRLYNKCDILSGRGYSRYSKLCMVNKQEEW